MARINIRRPHSYFAVARKAKVIMDEEVIATVRDTEDINIDVIRGTHTLQIGYRKTSGMSNILEFKIRGHEKYNVKLQTNQKLYLILTFIKIILFVVLLNGIIERSLLMIGISGILLILIQYYQSKNVLSISLDEEI